MKKFLCIFLLQLCIQAQDLNPVLSNLQNPFSNPHFDQIQNLELQAILPHKVKINHQWYRLHDKVNQAYIKAIEKGQVMLEYDGELIIIKPKINDKISLH